jgi:hypothetical protein
VKDKEDEKTFVLFDGTNFSADEWMGSSVVKLSDSILLQKINQSGNHYTFAAAMHLTPVDVTKFKTMRVKISGYKYNGEDMLCGYIGLAKSMEGILTYDNIDSWLKVKKQTNIDSNTYDIDISNLSGIYHVGLTVKTIGAGVKYATCAIRVYYIEFL